MTEVLQGLADIENAIVTDWAKQTDSFQLSVTEFIAAPSSATLADAQTKWKQARDPWESNESFGFGPVGNDGIDGNTDDPDRVHAIISRHVTEPSCIRLGIGAARQSPRAICGRRNIQPEMVG